MIWGALLATVSDLGYRMAALYDLGECWTKCAWPGVSWRAILYDLEHSLTHITPGSISPKPHLVDQHYIPALTDIAGVIGHKKKKRAFVSACATTIYWLGNCTTSTSIQLGAVAKDYNRRPAK